jgi:hypothetical protein
MRGSLHIGTRLESGFALIAYLISRVTGGSAEPRDFMPHADTPEGSLDDVLNILSGRRQ